MFTSKCFLVKKQEKKNWFCARGKLGNNYCKKNKTKKLKLLFERKTKTKNNSFEKTNKKKEVAV